MLSEIFDVIYIIRNGIVDTSELRYSLRSLDNLQHGDVWIAGGDPQDIKPDRYLDIKQEGASKWERTTYTLRKICEAKETPDMFYLFNDDFFIMQPAEIIPPIYNGTLYDRIKSIGASRYAKQLKSTADELTRRGLGVNNYAVHIPLFIEKDKALEVLKEFDGWPMFRSLYGNYWNIGGENRPDVKIAQTSIMPAEDKPYLSTSNISFKYGLVGEHIRRTFKEKCKYEV